MSNTSATTVTVSTIQLALQELLATYQSEQAESRRDEDTYFIQYWDCACQTIYDVAAALHIPLEEQPSKRRPRTPDSLTELRSVDVQYQSNGLSEYRQQDRS